MRRKRARHNVDNELVVHILYDAVYRVGELVSTVQLFEMSEVATTLVAGQRMLDIPADGRIDIAARGLVVGKGELAGDQLWVVEVDLPLPEGAAVGDIVVDVMNAKQARVLAKRDERGVDGRRPVVQLVVQRQPESQ